MTKISDNATARLSELFIKPTTGKVVSSEHRSILALICAEAKASGVSVEKLIVSLKGVFDQMPHSAEGAPTRTELRERLIAVCIEEFYGDGKPTS